MLTMVMQLGQCVYSGYCSVVFEVDNIHIILFGMGDLMQVCLICLIGAYIFILARLYFSGSLA